MRIRYHQLQAMQAPTRQTLEKAGLGSIANWIGFENGLWVCEARLVAGNDGARSSNAWLANFSMHAIARWFQRSRRSSDAELMHDMNLVANIDMAAIDGGGWRGRIAVVEDTDRMAHRVVMVRTWLEN